jgi:hypothetical protein
VIQRKHSLIQRHTEFVGSGSKGAFIPELGIIVYGGINIGRGHGRLIGNKSRIQEVAEGITGYVKESKAKAMCSVSGREDYSMRNLKLEA